MVNLRQSDTVIVIDNCSATGHCTRRIEYSQLVKQERVLFGTKMLWKTSHFDIRVPGKDACRRHHWLPGHECPFPGVHREFPRSFYFKFTGAPMIISTLNFWPSDV